MQAKSIIKFSASECEMIVAALDYYAEDVFEFDAPCPSGRVRSALSSANAKLGALSLPESDDNELPLTRLELVAVFYALQHIQEEQDHGDLLEDLLPPALCQQDKRSSLYQRLEAYLPSLGVRFV